MRRVIATLAVAAAVLAAGGAAAPGALAAPDGGGQSAAPLLIGMVSGSGEAMVKQDMDSPWNDEHSDVEQVAVAGDPTNGPLVGIVTGSGAALFKEGSLTAQWSQEVGTNVRAIAVASDATHGPLIAVLTWSGELMVKEGSLTAPCTPISDPVNGPLIGVQDIEDGSDGRLLVQTGGLDGSWNVENTDVAPGALSLSG